MTTNPIQTHFVVLCNELNVGIMLPYLRAERMVTTEEYETLSNTVIPIRQRRERLLIMMPRKGSDFFENFGKCLVWSGQMVLARHIGVDVSAVPSCPHSQNSYGVVPQDQFHALSSMMSPGGSLPPGLSVPGLSAPPVTHPHSQVITPPVVQEDREYYDHLRRQQGIIGQASHPASVQGSQLPPQPNLPRPYPPKSYLLASDPVYEEMSNFYPQGPHRQSYRPPSPVHLIPQPLPQPSPPPTDPKVFILYHKDSDLQRSHNISADDFVSRVLDMARILNSVGGFELSFDLFHQEDVGNWGTWTETKVKESRYVVLLCSPRLGTALRHPVSRENRQLDTERGSFFTNSFVNLIQFNPEKFIPVFLSNCVDERWIPNALLAAAKYTLDIDNFVDLLQSKPGSREYYGEVFDALRMQQFQEWERLVRHLRGTSHEVPPPPPSQPYTAGPLNEPSVSRERYISEGDLLIIAQTVSTNWKMLGIRLGVPYSAVEELDRRHPDPTSAAMEMFGLWKQTRGTEATRSALKVALIENGFGKITERLFAHD